MWSWGWQWSWPWWPWASPAGLRNPLCLLRPGWWPSLPALNLSLYPNPRPDLGLSPGLYLLLSLQPPPSLCLYLDLSFLPLSLGLRLYLVAGELSRTRLLGG